MDHVRSLECGYIAIAWIPQLSELQRIDRSDEGLLR